MTTPIEAAAEAVRSERWNRADARGSSERIARAAFESIPEAWLVEQIEKAESVWHMSDLAAQKPLLDFIAEEVKLALLAGGES